MKKEDDTKQEVIDAYLKAQDELFEEIQDTELFFDKSKLDKVLLLKKKFEEMMKKEK